MDATAWTDAEAALRAHLTKLGPAPAALARIPGHTFADFQFTSPDGAPGGAVVVGGKIFVRGARSNRTVTAILRAAKVHATHELGASDLVYLLDKYGAFSASQRDLARAIATLSWPPGYPPKLDWGKHSATLTLHWLPTSRRRPGAGAGKVTRLGKATLTISSGYALSWKLSSTTVDVSAFDASGS